MKLLIALLLSVNCFATNHYWAASGNDANAGTIGSPWQTTTKFNSSFASFSPGDSCLFNRGDVFTGSITISRSGSSGNPIVIGAYGTGAKPVITAFYTVPSWTSIGGGLYTAVIPAGLSTLNMVTFDGAFQAMGRWPKLSAANSGYLLSTSHTTTSITNASLSGALNYSGGEIVIRKTHWILDREIVSSMSGTTVNFSNNNTQYPILDGFGFFFQNTPVACTALGDWAYNGSTHTLTMFFGGGGPGGHTVKGSSIDNLVTISGRSFITFDNIAFQGSNSKTFNISSSNNLKINACDLSFNGINGVVTSSTSSNTTFITNSTISYTNNNSIIANESTSWTIQNNIITNNGMIPGMGLSGDGNYFTMQDIGDNSLVEHNEVGNSGYLGMDYTGNNITIQNNYFHDFCMIKDDGAAIYTGRQTVFTNRKVLNNIIINGGNGGLVDNGTNDAGSSYGIYVDQASQNVQISGNTAASCYGGGIHLNSASNIQVTNNTFFDNLRNFDYTTYSEAGFPITNVTQTGNIFFARLASQLCGWAYVRNGSTVNSWGTWNNNYYCRPILEPSGINVNGSYGNAATGGVLQIVTEGASSPTKDYSVDTWKTASGQDGSSAKTFATVTNVNKIRFEYNGTQSPVVVTLTPNNYAEVNGTAHSGTITLQPYTSIILLQTGTSNIPPTVNAGSNKTTTLPANSVSVTGTASDIDGSVTSTVWTKFSGPASFNIVTPGSLTTTINNLVAGVYQFQLQATDNSGGVSVSQVQVTVNSSVNILPVANAGSDITITLPVNSVNLTGSGTDADGSISSYQWTKLSGPGAYTITSPTSNNTGVTNLVQGVYQFQLKVTDNSGGTATDAMQVTVNAGAPPANILPVANAGLAQTISLPTSSVTLTGSGTDADGTVVAYNWTKTSGPAQFSIITPTTAQTIVNNLAQGVYQFQLQVTDNSGGTGVSTTTVTVNPAIPPPCGYAPISKAGKDATVFLPSTSYQFNGLAADYDGFIVSTNWVELSGPNIANIQTPGVVYSTVSGLVKGTYKFRMYATDNCNNTVYDDMILTVRTCTFWDKFFGGCK